MRHQFSRTNVVVAVGLALLTGLRLWVCGRFELIGDEAYYWQWSRHLDWCYYSKGPLVAWTIRVGTFLFGNTPFGIRVLSVCLGTATLILLYRLTCRLFSPRIAVWTLVLAACTPLFVIGSLLMTIDPLFIFFWIAAAFLFWRAQETDRITPWLLTGAAVGLGMLAKYTNAALLPSFMLFLLWSKPHRVHLRRPGFWLMCLTALACLIPVLWWNARHNWITLVHLQERGALDRTWQFSGREFLEYLGGQAGAYYPLFFLGILFSLIHGRVRREVPAAYRFLASLVIPLLAFYSILALNDAGEANWTAAAIMSGLPLLAASGCMLGQARRSIRILGWAALIPAVILAGFILVAPVTPIPGVERLLYRARGWENLAQQVEQFQNETHATFIIGDHYQMASLLSFYMSDHPNTFIVDRPGIQNQYSFWPGYGEAMTGQDAVYVSRHAAVPDDLLRQFATISPVHKVWSQWRGQAVKPFFLYHCRRYRGKA